MTTSFAEALAPLAARLPRGVREHEVLRVAATVAGEDAEESALTAAREVLKWATKQAGTHLPDAAWKGESFDLPLPGRDPTAIRLKTPAADLWALRLHRPDRDVPGRAWTTEVVLGHIPGEPVRISTRLLVATDEANLAITPAVPGFLRQIAQNCGLIVGGQTIAAGPTPVQTRKDAEALIDHLTDPDRRHPTIVLTCFEGAGEPPLDAAALSGHLLGLAHVFVAHPEACWLLTEQLGKRLSVFGGAARVYQPGFDHAADPYAHHLVLAATLYSSDGVDRTDRWLRETAARASLHRSRLGAEVLTFASIRAASLEARQFALRETASDADQLAGALEQIKALQEEIGSLKREIDYYLGEHEKERERAEAAEAQARAAAWRIDHLTGKLNAVGTDPDSDLAYPSLWEEFETWCDQNLSGRLTLTPRARRGLQKPSFGDPETAARCLLWLATEARNRFMAGGGTLANVPILDGIQNAPCGADAYEFDHSDRRFTAEWHAKNGGNTRDPSRCLRIYYCFDPQAQQIIVSDMPAHRRTGAT